MSSDRANVSDNALRDVMDGQDAQDRMEKDRNRRGDYKPKIATVYKWVTEDTIQMAIKAAASLKKALAWLVKEQKQLQEEESIAARFGPECRLALVTPRQARLAELAIIIAEVTLEIAEIERKQTSVLAITKTTRERTDMADQDGHSNHDGGGSRLGADGSQQQTRGGPSS